MDNPGMYDGHYGANPFIIPRDNEHHIGATLEAKAIFAN